MSDNTNSSLQSQWNHARRFRGSPASAIGDFFDPSANIALLSIGRLFSGHQQIEQLMDSYRKTHQSIVEFIVLSCSFDESSGTVTEEVEVSFCHNQPFDWVAGFSYGDSHVNGELITFQMCTVSQLSMETGLIVKQRAYWDTGKVLSQLKLQGPASRPQDVLAAFSYSPQSASVSQSLNDKSQLQQEQAEQHHYRGQHNQRDHASRESVAEVFNPTNQERSAANQFARQKSTFTSGKDTPVGYQQPSRYSQTAGGNSQLTFG